MDLKVPSMGQCLTRNLSIVLILTAFVVRADEPTNFADLVSKARTASAIAAEAAKADEISKFAVSYARGKPIANRVAGVGTYQRCLVRELGAPDNTPSLFQLFLATECAQSIGRELDQIHAELQDIPLKSLSNGDQFKRRNAWQLALATAGMHVDDFYNYLSAYAMERLSDADTKLKECEANEE